MKPDNFLMGVNKRQDVCYMIDFGLSKRFRDPKTGEHIPYRDGKSLTGTARYASVNTHIGIEQSRRDDLESVGYILLYFLKGALPWQGLAGKNKNEKYDRIKEKKIQTTISEVTRGAPEEFTKYLQYCRNMQFEEKPDYNYLRQLFKSIMSKHSYEHDQEYDWVLKKQGGTAKLKEIIAQETRTPQPEAKPPAGMGVRSNSKNLYDNREERKISVGQQIVAGDSNRMLPPKQGSSNPFANQPQYKNGVNLALKNNPGFRNQSIQMQRGANGPQAHGVRNQTPTGNQGTGYGRNPITGLPTSHQRG